MTDEVGNAIDHNALSRRLARSRRASAFIHERVADELASRLDYLALVPSTIIDLGAMHGQTAALLAERYPKASITALESAAPIARGLGRRRWGFGKRRVEVVSNTPIDNTGLPDDAADLVVANLSATRFSTPDGFLAEAFRLLKTDGVFLFATLGPDSLREVRDAWAQIDDTPHVADFIDMHDFGDALGRAGFREPVLDTERLDIRYASVDDLWRDLTASGARNSLLGRRRGLTSKARFERFRQALAPDGQPFTVTLELVHGHCFGGTPRQRQDAISISPTNIPVRSRT
ncbi:MAG: methyltransferase domain-containing protein [Pseudomonadota bacterium]